MPRWLSLLDRHASTAVFFGLIAAGVAFKFISLLEPLP